MDGGTGRLPGRDVCRDGTFFILGLHENVSTWDDFTRDVCRDGMFFIPGLHENVSTWDDFTRDVSCTKIHIRGKFLNGRNESRTTTNNAISITNVSGSSCNQPIMSTISSFLLILKIRIQNNGLVSTI